MGHPLKGPREYWAPPGYFSAAGAAANTLRRSRPLNEMSYQELQDEYHLVVGSPDTVIKKLRYIKEELGIGALLLEAQGGPLSHADTIALAGAVRQGSDSGAEGGLASDFRGGLSRVPLPIRGNTVSF